MARLVQGVYKIDFVGVGGGMILVPQIFWRYGSQHGTAMEKISEDLKFKRPSK